MQTAPDLSFIAKKTVELLLLPPSGPLLLMIAGLVLLSWRPRLGRALGWLGVAYGVAACLPSTVALLLGGLETAPPISPEALKSGQAIVVLSGGRRGYAPEFGGQTVNPLSLERLRYGARLARQTGLPVLLSGGAPSHGEPEAELMRRALEEDFHIKPRWTEITSLDTAENARYSAPLLRLAHVQRIVLVTHAAHMRRAQHEFEAMGFTVLPAPTAFLGGPPQGAAPAEHDALAAGPSANSAYAGWYALHEWLGILAQSLRG